MKKYKSLTPLYTFLGKRVNLVLIVIKVLFGHRNYAATIFLLNKLRVEMGILIYYQKMGMFIVLAETLMAYLD